MLGRFFNDPPPQDAWERTGQILGTFIGVAVMAMMAWVVLRGL